MATKTMATKTMATETKTWSKDEVREYVARYLEPHQPSDYRLNIVGVKQDNDYFYVVVQPDKDNIRSFDYYNRLAETEGDLEEIQNLNVLLVPAVPGD